MNKVLKLIQNKLFESTDIASLVSLGSFWSSRSLGGFTFFPLWLG